MTNSVGSTSQNIALQPAAAPPVDPAAEAMEREKEREVIQTLAAVRQAPAAQPAPAHQSRPGRVDRVA